MPSVVQRKTADVAQAIRMAVAQDAKFSRVFRRVAGQRIGDEVARILIAEHHVIGVTAASTIYEALVRSIYTRALNGNSFATKLIMDRLLPAVNRVELSPGIPGIDLTDEELQDELSRLEKPLVKTITDVTVGEAKYDNQATYTQPQAGTVITQVPF